MNEVIVFPSVEGLLVPHLKNVLPNTAVATKVPATRPARFIRVSKVGGTKVRLNADSAMVTFQVWEADQVKASALAELTRAYVHAMAGETIGNVWIYRVRDVGSPAYNPDPETKADRYQFTVSIDVKGVAQV